MADLTYDKISGWCDFDNLYLDMIQQAKENSVFVEIGTWLGRSTASMATKIKQSKKNITFWAVDTFKGSVTEKWHTNYVAEQGGSIRHLFDENIRLCGLEEYVHVLEMTSLEASKRFANGSLDFVFIDGDHSYPAVCNDIKTWLPKLKYAGVLAGHDYTWPSVKSAVSDIIGSSLVRQNGTSWMYRRKTTMLY